MVTAKAKPGIYTIGHSTRPIEEFTAILKSFKIQTIVDVRTIPQSRYNPQFKQENLSQSLAYEKIAYSYMKELGGLRKARKDSPNTGWRNTSFRGYADHMQSEEFLTALENLISKSESSRTAIMCAEAVPWRCHRSLIADALIIRGIPVEHIMAQGKSSPHKLTKFAEVKGKAILYPPEQAQLI